MATLIVRRVDALKERALRHGRSAEAEHRAILEAELIGHTPSAQEMLDYFRLGAELGLDEVELGRHLADPVERPALD